MAIDDGMLADQQYLAGGFAEDSGHQNSRRNNRSLGDWDIGSSADFPNLLISQSPFVLILGLL
jgi:hypothetical protein